MSKSFKVGIQISHEFHGGRGEGGIFHKGFKRDSRIFLVAKLQ